MSPAYQYYLITLLIFFGVNTIACWSLNIQYGVGGVMNFAFVMFQALGAYVGGVLTLGPSTGASFQQYIFGATLPFPLPWIVAAAAGAALAWIVGSFALRPARRDFQAMVMLKVYVLGGALASLSGAILVQFIGAWSPGSWETGETFLYFVAIIVGGAGNNFGAMLGAAVVLGVFEESLRYLPSFGYAGLAEAVQFMLLGVLILAFLWFRPSGLVPERRRRLTRLLPAADPPGGEPPSGTGRPTAAGP